MTRALGVLVSYRRPRALGRALSAIEGSSMHPDPLLVIDHEAGAETTAAVEAAARRAPWIVHVPLGRNLGPAGGRAEGMRRLLLDADDGDWIVVFDDDDPLPAPDLLRELVGHADALAGADPRIAGVGLRGSVFDRRRGYPVPVTHRDPHGDVPVDYLHGGFFPCYRVGAVRDVGVFRASLFFGWADLEYGLRLRRGGYALRMAADLWRRHREALGHPEERIGPSRRLEAADARRYFRMRNWFRLLPEYAGWTTTARVVVMAGLAKPLANLPSEPALAWRHLRLNVRAAFDAARGVRGDRAPRRFAAPPSMVEA